MKPKGLFSSGANEAGRISATRRPGFSPELVAESLILSSSQFAESVTIEATNYITANRFLNIRKVGLYFLPITKHNVAQLPR